MLDRKLDAWIAAGLLDQAAAARIRAYEASHSRPLALWAVVGIAALSIGLGIISLIAANWDAIPAQARLGTHLALLALIAAVVWRWGGRLAAEHPWLYEAALFVFGALGLAFIGHVSQAYQTTAALWQALVLWLALFAPLVLARGRGTLSALVLAGVLMIAAWNFANDYGAEHGRVYLFALVTSAPLLLIPAGAAMRESHDRGAFWRALERLGVAYAVWGASGMAVITGFDQPRADEARQIVTAAMIWGAASGAIAALVWKLRRSRSGMASAAVLGACAVATWLAAALLGHPVWGALLFMALWGAIAAAALQGGWRGVFQLAVAMVALRLIVLSFELENDLLSSGAGLIVSGLLMLGVSWAAVRIARRFAPARARAAP